MPKFDYSVIRKELDPIIRDVSNEIVYQTPFEAIIYTHWIFDPVIEDLKEKYKLHSIKLKVKEDKRAYGIIIVITAKKNFTFFSAPYKLKITVQLDEYTLD